MGPTQSCCSPGLCATMCWPDYARKPEHWHERPVHPAGAAAQHGAVLPGQPRITRAEAAAELGVTAKQLEEDLNQLWMCGLPGYSRVTSSTSNSAVTPSR